MALTISAPTAAVAGSGVPLAIDAALQSQAESDAAANVAALFGSVGLGASTDALA